MSITLEDNIDYGAIESVLVTSAEKALKALGEDIVAAAQAYLWRAGRIDTGNLAGSIKHKIEKKGDNFVLYVFTDVEYGIYIEYGTGIYAENGMGRKPGWYYQTPDGKYHFTEGLTPTPFLRPAYDDNVGKFYEYLIKYIIRALK